MSDMKKYEGIIPAFYACYDAEGKVNPVAVRELTRWFIEKGVHGLYVGGSSGECIYQSKEERKLVLENVMAEAKGKITVIAHIACNNTADSQELAAHAESLGVDAIDGTLPRQEGDRLAASYANYYTGNGFVALPVFNDPKDKDAIELLQKLYPDRVIEPIYAREILLGGGNIHCITQQLPSGRQ